MYAVAFLSEDILKETTWSSVLYENPGSLVFHLLKFEKYHWLQNLLGGFHTSILTSSII